MSTHFRKEGVMHHFEARWIPKGADQSNPANWTWFTVAGTNRYEAVMLADTMVRQQTVDYVLVVSEVMYTVGIVQPPKWLGNADPNASKPVFRTVRDVAVAT